MTPFSIAVDVNLTADSQDLRATLGRSLSRSFRSAAGAAGVDSRALNSVPVDQRDGVLALLPGADLADMTWRLLGPISDQIVEVLRTRLVTDDGDDMPVGVGPSELAMPEPPLDRGAWFRSASTMWPRRFINPRDVVREFVLRLIVLWRRADHARFARALVLQLRAGRVWADFRPARPPGRIIVSCGHMTRGPDVSRMTQVLVIRGEPLAST